MAEAWESEERDDRGRFSGGGSGGGDGGSLSTSGTTITRTEAESVGTYQNEGYQEINGALRGFYQGAESEAEIGEHIANIDAAIGKSTLVQDTTVYRGISEMMGGQSEGSLAPFVNAEVGTTVTDPGFTSTSLSPQTASFFGKMTGGDAFHTLEIRAAAGTTALDTVATEGLYNGITSADLGGASEQEILFPRNAQMTVLEQLPGRTVLAYGD